MFLALSYDQTPSYDYLRTLFMQLLSKEGYQLDGVFEWSGMGIVTLPDYPVSTEHLQPVKLSTAEVERVRQRQAEREKEHEKERKQRGYDWDSNQ